MPPDCPVASPETIFIMKPTVLWVAVVIAFTAFAFAAERAVRNEGAKPKPKLRHVVAFKFKPTASTEQIKQVETAFRELKTKIPEIAEFEWGTNNSPEGRNKGCTHGFILTFTSEKDRDAYLPHPAHKEFGKLVGPLLDDVFVIDFWAKE
jgi:hypothetical protein